ncbi:MAG TPA: hypothetical protein VI564_08980 [Candidatus Nanoarchaeia archaeon]|nr:hypothetical protein [Candidatus Nanoarchaeia archaeon]
MTKPLSSEQMHKYSALWNKFGDNPFKFNEAEKILKISENHLLVTLHRLKMKGWLTTEKDEKRPKKSLYFLVSPNDAVKVISK